MARGLRPVYRTTETFKLTGLELLVTAAIAAERLQWTIGDIKENSITFYSSISFWSYGETISFATEEGSNMASIESRCSQFQLFDGGKNKKNVTKLRDMIETVRQESMEVERIRWMNDYKRTLEEIENSQQKADENEFSFLHFFIPHKGFIATPLLTDINLLIYIGMLLCGVHFFTPENIELIRWGANFGPLTLTGDWWRLITCNFIHIGILHLLMNMYAFLFIGIWFEPLLGSRRMFSAYLITGIAGAFASLMAHQEVISAGASGAVFGLYGVFLAFLLFHREGKEYKKVLLTGVSIFILYNLVYGMKEGIDNAAHIGGLIGGFILGIAYAFADKRKDMQQRQTLIWGSECLFLIILFYSFHTLVSNKKELYADFRENYEKGDENNAIGLNIEIPESSDKQDNVLPIENGYVVLPYEKAINPVAVWDTFRTEGFSCQYPPNWRRVSIQEAENENTPLARFVNGFNQINIQQTFRTEGKDMDTEWNNFLQFIKEHQEYNVQTIRVAGNELTEISGDLHIGSPKEKGLDVKQYILTHYSPKHQCITTIVMIYRDEEARDDMEKMKGTIRFFDD